MTEPVSNEAEQVNKEEPVHVEMITKEPIARSSQNPVVTKIKDPRKIEAGKKLAAYNKKEKKSKAELKENSATTVVDSDSDQGGPGFNITLTTVVAIIGLGLTGVDLYLRHKKMNEKGVKYFKMVVNGKCPTDAEVENEKINKKDIGTVSFSQGME